MATAICDAHRHLGAMPAWPFYGGPPVHPAIREQATIAGLLRDLDDEGTEQALVIPNYGVPDPDAAFALNDLCLEAAASDERVSCGLWVSARPEDEARTDKALALAGEDGVVALKLSFLLGGAPADPSCRPLLDRIFAAAEAHGLVVHVHTSPGGASDIDEVGKLVEWYGDRVALHLVHLGGGASGHIKLIGGRFFDWVAAGKRVYTDASWAIGFAPRWLAAEIERQGIGHDRLLFASDEPWSDREGELARMAAAMGDGELARLVFSDNYRTLYRKD
ncbi:MAG TPA: amidohydrolase family protein [Acidimicrobiales bacterium]|nr:amidohydrolase family protein [Acidimicrobiales bacterium]